MDYWTRQEKLNLDLLWNLPEQKIGSVQIIGGNSSNFAAEIKITEFLNTLNLKTVRLCLPDSLRNKIPPLPDLSFAPATDSGSFAKSPELNAAFNSADVTFVTGDLSKNSATSIGIAEGIKSSQHPVIVTRDGVDSIAPEMSELLNLPHLTLVCSFVQLQKIFRTIYYPKMLLLSMPLNQAIETLHKFTLSYPCTILTFHQEQIIVAHSGEITTIPINTTNYSPISLWSGQLAGRIAALSAWTPNQPYQNAIAAVHWN